MRANLTTIWSILFVTLFLTGCIGEGFKSVTGTNSAASQASQTETAPTTTSSSTTTSTTSTSTSSTTTTSSTTSSSTTSTTSSSTTTSSTTTSTSTTSTTSSSTTTSTTSTTTSTTTTTTQRPQNSDAWYENDWDYANMNELSSDPGIGEIIQGSAGSVTLVNNISGAPEGFTNAVRATYFANQGGEPTVGLNIVLPRAEIDRPREIWFEFYARFSNNWTTNGPYGGNPDHKFVFLMDQEPSGSWRWENMIGTFGSSILTLIGGEGSVYDYDYNNPSSINDLWDGQWHRFQYHARMDSQNGAWELWIDGRHFPYQNIPNTNRGPGYFFKYIALSRNMNRGVSQNMHIDFGLFRAYIENPGW